MVGLSCRRDSMIQSTRESAMLRNHQKIICFIDQEACGLSTGKPLWVDFHPPVGDSLAPAP